MFTYLLSQTADRPITWQRSSAFHRVDAAKTARQSSKPASEWGKKENLSDFEHDEYGCRCQMGCCSECFTNCWSPGIFTTSQPSQDFTENGPKKRKIPSETQLWRKMPHWCWLEGFWICLSATITLDFHLKSFCTSGLQDGEQHGRHRWQD